MTNLKLCACAAALMISSASLAFTQSFVGKAYFTLPYAAHWNSTVLEPGEYQLSVPDSTSWPQIIRLSKDGQTISLLSAVETEQGDSRVSELRLKEIGSTTVVTDLVLGPAGRSFHFTVPKSVRQEVAVRGRANTKTVALVSAHK